MMKKDELTSNYGEDLHWEHFKEAIDQVKSLGSECSNAHFILALNILKTKTV